MKVGLRRELAAERSRPLPASSRRCNEVEESDIKKRRLMVSNYKHNVVRLLYAGFDFLGFLGFFKTIRPIFYFF